QILSMVTSGLSEGDAHANPHINETCCVYNLLKLTKDLNSFNPDDARYMDYYERTLYNQIIGSLHPTHYGVTYHYAVGLNASKPFGSRNPQATCCGGTGSENHVKYQEATYFTSDNELWVALYMPTTLEWEEKGVTIQQECLWPAESSTIRITAGEAEFGMKLRVPYWATEGFDIKVDGKSLAKSYQPCSYAVIPSRSWKVGDVIEITMPFTKHIDYGADKLEIDELDDKGQKIPSSWVGTLMYGPLAMSATDVTEWKDAVLNVDSYLATIGVGARTGVESGTAGNLYTLTQGGRVFQPDYYRHDHTTHYFRINHVTDPTAELKMTLGIKLKEAAAFDAKDYTKKSYSSLKTAVKACEKLLNAAALSEIAISSGIESIDKAINDLVAVGLNKSKLETAILAAESNNASLYTAESYEALQVVLNTARGVMSSANSQVIFDKQTFALNEASAQLVLASSVDKSTLNELLVIAQQRKAEQENWNALEVKVPEFAPWAPFGFTRLQYTLEEALRVNQNSGKNYSQVEVNTTVTSLNKSINTMRPGNLAEIEDLRPLSALLRRAGTLNESSSQELKEAVEFAQMVMKYVGDGSGTHDMIATAIERMKKATGQ
ncbi:MAG: beta-L-arabinofuranosidase domain-containing protein, partial [Phocaeicola sp.]